MNVPRISNPSHVWVIAAALFIAALVVTWIAYQVPVNVRIDVGSGDDSPFVRGFSFRENLPDGTNARWSSGRSTITFSGIGGQEGILRLRLAAPRPSAPAQVQILANGTDVTRPTNDAAMHEQVIAIDRAILGIRGDLVIELNSDTFVQPPDNRPLGLLVDSASFETTGTALTPARQVLFYLPAFVVLAFAILFVWTGHLWLSLVGSCLVMGMGAMGLVNSRVETAYFIGPLFWILLFLFGLALVLVLALGQLARALGNAPVTNRTWRLLFLVMLVAFGVRMLFATGAGYIVDVQDYVVWSYKTVTHGIGTAYLTFDGLWSADNPPGMLYVFDAMGRLYQSIFAPDFLYPAVAGDPNLRAISDNAAVLADPVHRTLLRLPFLLGDLITGALIFIAARKNLSERAAWLIALCFWFNPAVLWNGAYWGQTDALHSFLILAAFLLLSVKRVGWGFFIYGIAALVKPQATIFAPLLLLYAWRVDAWRGIIRGSLAGAAGAMLMLLPMILSGGLTSMLGFFQNVAGFHPVLSANAHNFWWFVRGGDADLVDTLPIIAGFPLSYRLTSLLMFGGVYFAVLWKARRAALDDFFAWGAYIAFAFFMLVTEIHENHGYALLPLLAVAMARDAKLISFYVLTSITMTLNYALHDPPLVANAGAFDLAPVRWFNSLVNVVTLVAWTIYQFARRLAIVPSRAQNLPVYSE